MASVQRPIQSMTRAIARHHILTWTAEHVSPGGDDSFMHHLKTDQLLAFLACHRHGHSDCAKKPVNINCWELVTWAAVLAYFERVLPTSPVEREAWLKRWPSTRLPRAIQQELAAQPTDEAEDRALRAFFLPFVNKDATQLHLFDHPIEHISDAKTKPLVKAHAFSIDSILAFETWDYVAGRDKDKLLSEVAHSSGELLLNLNHIAVVVSSEPSHALQSKVVGLWHDDLGL
jgi:hypothetical protein